MANSIPEQTTLGPDEGDVLVLGWGGTRGAITGAVNRLRKQGYAVSAASIRYLNPFPKNLADLMKRFRRVVCAELNGGQLSMLLRARFLIDVQPLTKVEGQPFGARELEERLLEELAKANANSNGATR